MSILHKVKPYFNFTPNERKGIVVLLIILLLVVILSVGLPYLKQEQIESGISFDQIEVKSFESKHLQQNIRRDNSEFTVEKKSRDSILIFDPNKASLKTLINVGFSEFGAKNLIKYRDRGGYIESYNELNKIYGVDSTFVKKLDSQVSIPPKKKKQLTKQSFESNITIEINTANADKLQIIPCVGPVISKRIIKYRSQLGGFISTRQFEEIYGIDSSCYSNILTYLVVDASLIQKLNLNTIEEKRLSLHPYITKYQARAIVKYRELMGAFTRISQLTENHIFLESELQKLEDYLSL